jgi:hypothetical protein
MKKQKDSNPPVRCNALLGQVIREMVGKWCMTGQSTAEAAPPAPGQSSPSSQAAAEANASESSSAALLRLAHLHSLDERSLKVVRQLGAVNSHLLSGFPPVPATSESVRLESCGAKRPNDPRSPTGANANNKKKTQ